MTIKTTNHEIDMERIHPDLREKIVLIPAKRTSLMPEEVQEFFGGDLTALQDIIKLVQQRTPEAEE